MNEALSKAIYVSGTPFSIVEHELWQGFFHLLRPSYRLPSRKSISTTLLDKEYASTKADVLQLLNDSSVLHLQCDGWSNVRVESIINFIVTQPKPVFVDFLATKENKHTIDYLFAQIDSQLNTYGPNKFFVVIADNAPNMQGALSKVSEKYEHITALGCTAHTLNLVAKDFIKVPLVDKLIGQAKSVINTIKNSHRFNSIFTDKQKEKKVKRALKMPHNIRWGSVHDSMERLLHNKQILQLLSVDDEVNLPDQPKKLILDDNFWSKVQSLSSLLKPISDAITQVETNNAIIHKAYEIITNTFNEVINQVDSISTQILTVQDKRLMSKKLDERKKQLIKPIFYAANILNPVSMGSSLTPEEKMAGTEFIYETAKKFKLNEQKVMTEYANYMSKEDIWGKSFVWTSVENITPIIWWKSFFGFTELQKIANRILTAPITSAASERSFSAFGFIHTKKRNRLTAERAGKVTFVSHNYKLLGSKTSSMETSTPMDIDQPGTSTAENNEPIDVEESSSGNENELELTYSDVEEFSDIEVEDENTNT